MSEKEKIIRRYRQMRNLRLDADKVIKDLLALVGGLGGELEAARAYECAACGHHGEMGEEGADGEEGDGFPGELPF